MDSEIELFEIYNIDLGGSPDGDSITGDIDFISKPMWKLVAKKKIKVTSNEDLGNVRASRVSFLVKAYRFLEQKLGIKSGDNGLYPISPWNNRKELEEEFGMEAIEFFKDTSC